MANFTQNYNLKKPLPEEFYNIQDHNDNMDIVDSELKKLNDRKADLDANGKVLKSQLPEGTPTAESMGKPGGAATLDENGKIPVEQLPEGIPTEEDKGQPNGFASLDDTGKVPSEQLPEISSAKPHNIVLYTYGWNEGADGRYYQEVIVEGVTTDPKQIVFVDIDLTTDDEDARIAYLEAWEHPSANEVDQVEGKLIFYSYEMLTVNIPVNVVVM